MPRKLRIQYPGAIYHVLNRGDRREPIARDDEDRESFLRTLGETCGKTGWQVLALCLMPNHFHLVVETPAPTLVAGMKWFLGTFTTRFNRRHKLSGHLFSGRYKSLVVDDSTPGYLKTVCDYVHLNPVRAGMVTAAVPLKSYAWSSFPEYLKRAARRPAWLRVERLLGEHGIARDSPSGRAMFEQRMEERRRAGDQPEAWAAVRRGWCLGEEAFRKELLAQVSEQRGAHHYGAELQEGEEEKAERMVRAQLARWQWSKEDLAGRAKTDRRKARLARRLRRETTMTLAWIAGRLRMGSVNTLKNTLQMANSRD